MPLLAHGINHTALDRAPARPADRHTHFIVTREAVEFTLQFTSISGQLLTVTHTTLSRHFEQTGAAVENCPARY